MCSCHTCANSQQYNNQNNQNDNVQRKMLAQQCKPLSHKEIAQCCGACARKRVAIGRRKAPRMVYKESQDMQG
jgi:hypothetical protein